MPLYQYVCEKCDHPFEALVFAGDDETSLSGVREPASGETT